MNVLKALGEQPYFFKCHKMLKTSNNLYLVYDLMGKYPTLSELIENLSISGQARSTHLLMSRKKYRIASFEVLKIIEITQHFVSRSEYQIDRSQWSIKNKVPKPIKCYPTEQKCKLVVIFKHTNFIRSCTLA